MIKNRILSGVQPTGNLHLGNYLGAIKNFVKLQKDYECYFMLADLHSITVFQDPKQLRENIIETAAVFLACGLDPKKNVIFCQSSVAGHSELAWIFNCVARIGWLNRMTQFKEKAGSNKEKASVGLYSYPTLMAADILLYKATHVPVGEDQKQHLELTRDIAVRINHLFGQPKQPILKLPDPMIRKEGARVMSLTDGRNKMSKSDPSEMSRINILDSPDVIAKKIKRCKTDLVKGLTFDDPERPECHNLLTLYSILSGKSQDVVAGECAELGWGQFKPMLTEVTIESLKPIQEKYAEIREDKDYLATVLRQGRLKAEAVANQTLDRVKNAMGYLPPF